MEQGLLLEYAVLTLRQNVRSAEYAKRDITEANLIDGMRVTGSTTEAQIKEWLEGNGYSFNSD